ncbi:MAG TPA: HAD family hydrolase [Candidatus Limnocylindrales bacterium]|nr:HAD family hydrolase [Candidatus Limnocylindrales bacterium]
MTGVLASWRDTPARTAILDFVGRITATGSGSFVAPAGRVAVFDNDGTLWCERPTYTQAFFVMARLRELAADDPGLAARPVVRALLTGDLAGAFAMGIDEVAGVVLETHAGMTVDAFAEEAAAWLGSAVHPRFGVPFGELTYRPMLQLLDLLRAHEFRVFIVTGGGVDFVRSVSSALYRVPPDDVVGTAVEVAFERSNGRTRLVRQPRLLGGVANEGEPKPRAIHAHIGARPILAAGNSAGDREMLEYATTGDRPGLGLVIDHDDAEREYEYESRSATDPGAEPILESAARHGWRVVSMRRDWETVFGA